MAQVMKGKAYISFSRNSFVSGIETPNAGNVKADNEVEVPDSDGRCLQRVFQQNISM